jgi:hypothetical protein
MGVEVVVKEWKTKKTNRESGKAIGCTFSGGESSNMQR